MPEQDLPDAADSGDTTREEAAEPPRPRADAPEVTAPPPEAAAATAQVDTPSTPAVFSSPTRAALPLAVSAAPEAAPGADCAPASPAALAPELGKPARVRPTIEWRSFSGWFCLLWLLALAWLVSVALHGPGPVTVLPQAFLAKTAIASALAVILAFLVPVSLVDDSSHHTRAWWVAWLWPPVMALMLAADAVVIGGVALKLLPLLKMLKKH